MEFEAIIGLEIHMQLKSKSKLFSSAPARYDVNHNSSVMPLDMAFPGSLPVINKKCVVSAIRMVNALNMQIDKTLIFDRKNYFYSDLAKGYQITQQFHPIGKHGYLDIKTSKGEKRITIDHLHIEEDSAKQIHVKDQTLLDYNRSGMGLIEIVTNPDFRSGEEARVFLKDINDLAVSLGVTTGKLQEGTLRCDVNVSLRDITNNKDGTIIELKNLNGYKNVGKAIDAEIKRQLAKIKEGKTIRPSTRRYDEETNRTVFMRVKNKPIDYKYFTDANIIPIRLSDEFIEDALNYRKDKDALNQYLLSKDELKILSKDKELKNLFFNLVNDGIKEKTASNWLTVKIKGLMHKNGCSFKELDIDYENLKELLSMLDNGSIDNRKAAIIFEKMIDNKLSVIKIIEEEGFNDTFDDNKLLRIIDETLLECSQAVRDYKLGRTKAFNFLLGKIYQKYGDNIDQQVLRKYLLDKLGGN